MFSQKNKRKGFTLIEMLIVIVIIGILAAALIPRLTSARGRANDVARKADLAQVAAALVSYQIDHGSYPTCAGSTDGCGLSDISGSLISAGMNNIPSDPDNKRVLGGIANVGTGQYGYITIKKGGVTNNGFVLMASTQTEGGSNWVFHAVFTGGAEFNNIILCNAGFVKIGMLDDIGPGQVAAAAGPPGDIDASTIGCNYTKGLDVLKYIYMY